MEKRVLIAVLLSFLVLYAYQAMFPPPPDQAKKPVQASKAATVAECVRSGRRESNAVTRTAGVSRPSGRSWSRTPMSVASSRRAGPF